MVRTNMQPHTTVTSIQYLPKNANQMAAAYDDGAVILWDTTTYREASVFKQHAAPCTSIAISPLNTMLMVSGGLDGQIVIYDVSTKKLTLISIALQWWTFDGFLTLN
jgi:WD40 repeat protein